VLPAIGVVVKRAYPAALIYAGFFRLGLQLILWGVLLPDIRADLAMDAATSGWFFLTMTLGTISGAFLGGKYVQKFDFLKLFSGLALGVSLLLAALSTVHAPWQLLGLVGFFGLLASVMFTIGHTLIARLFAEKRARMMGIMDFMFSLGTLAAPFLVIALYWSPVLADWRVPVRLLAGLLALLALAGWFLAKHPMQLAVLSSQPKHSLSYRDALIRPEFVALTLAMFGYGAVEWGNGNWFVSYANDAVQMPTEQARFVFAFFTGGMVISRLGFSWLIPLFGVKRLLRLLALVMAGGALLLKLSDASMGLALGNLALGLGLGGLYPLLLSTAMDISPEQGPVLSGLSNIAGSLGSQLAGLGVGLWAQAFGLSHAFWFVPLLAVWLLSTAWLFSRRLPAPTESVPSHER